MKPIILLSAKVSRQITTEHFQSISEFKSICVPATTTIHSMTIIHWEGSEKSNTNMKFLLCALTEEFSRNINMANTNINMINIDHGKKLGQQKIANQRKSAYKTAQKSTLHNHRI